MSRRAKSRSAAWRKKQERDPFVRAARAEGYRSRAAFKLLQINQARNILRPGLAVVDLGAAPGGWTQVAVQLASPGGKIVAADILPIQPVPGATIVQGDFAQAETRQKIRDALGQPADLVLSDLAPNLSGIACADQARCAELAELVARFCQHNLRPGGTLLMKSFAGAGENDIRQILKPLFSRVRTQHPKASRPESREAFIFAIRDEIR